MAVNIHLLLLLIGVGLIRAAPQEMLEDGSLIDGGQIATGLPEESDLASTTIDPNQIDVGDANGGDLGGDHAEESGEMIELADFSDMSQDVEPSENEHFDEHLTLSQLQNRLNNNIDQAQEDLGVAQEDLVAIQQAQQLEKEKQEQEEQERRRIEMEEEARVAEQRLAEEEEKREERKKKQDELKKKQLEMLGMTEQQYKLNIEHHRNDGQNDKPAEGPPSQELGALFTEVEDNSDIETFDAGVAIKDALPIAIQQNAFKPMVEDEDSFKINNATDYVPKYGPNQLPRPRFVMLGQQGVGKSSIANSLLGFNNLAEVAKKKNTRIQLPFAVGHGLRSKTKMTSFSTGNWLGFQGSPNVTIVDTPGFKDQRDTEFVEELMNVLGDEVKEVDSFVVVYKYKDRFTSPFGRTLRVLTKMFGNFWTNAVILVNFWSFNSIHVNERKERRVTQAKYAKELTNIFQAKFNLDFKIPIVFIDSHYNRSNPEELGAFQRETAKLWKTSLNKRPFQCLGRGEIQAKLRNEKRDLAEERRRCRAIRKENKEFKSTVEAQAKMIESQKFVMTNLRNGIDYLKTTCAGTGINPVKGCKWAEWAPWSICSKTCGGGIRARHRERLPGVGTCDGDADQNDVCSEQEVCPLENDNTTMIVVIGGETTRENRENEHSTSVEIITTSGLCRLSGVPDLPEARGKMCAAYDPSGALIVCGGGRRFWRPNNNCWQLLRGFSTQWEEIPQIYPVHGAATTFYKGKFWVFGGSTGDDSYDHTITDKVQAYNPREQTWSVETSLTSPRHKACAVTIDSSIVITGGTMLGLGKVKPVWLAEIGTRTAEMFDGNSWSSLPSLSRAKVEHGCSVATISGSRGVIVVGGATGDDIVEFLDWELKKVWKQLGKLNRGRGMSPGVGFIGGTLSIVGGYSWPGAVDQVEQWDQDREEWQRKDIRLKYHRFNHATLTVPGDMFPQCAS